MIDRMLICCPKAAKGGKGDLRKASFLAFSHTGMESLHDCCDCVAFSTVEVFGRYHYRLATSFAIPKPGVWVYEVTYKKSDVSPFAWVHLQDGLFRRLTQQEALHLADGKKPWPKGLWV